MRDNTIGYLLSLLLCADTDTVVWIPRQHVSPKTAEKILHRIHSCFLNSNPFQIPQWCAEFCLSAQYQHGMVVCTQTNGQQAVGLALRVADEMDVNIGHEVGYTIPLETCCSSDTILRFVDESMS